MKLEIINTEHTVDFSNSGILKDYIDCFYDLWFYDTEMKLQDFLYDTDDIIGWDLSHLNFTCNGDFVFARFQIKFKLKIRELIKKDLKQEFLKNIWGYDKDDINSFLNKWGL